MVALCSEEEKHDPELYAENVRRLMASWLGMPISDATYLDYKLAIKRFHKKVFTRPLCDALANIYLHSFDALTFTFTFTFIHVRSQEVDQSSPDDDKTE